MRTSARPLAADATRAFQPTADRASLWLTGQYDDALRMLRAAVLGRQGLLVLVGEGGTGKTVLAHALAARVGDDAVVVGGVLSSILENMDPLAAVTETFGLQIAFKDRDGFVEQFRRFVADTAAGRRVLLIVDEAQGLSSELLVELGRLPYGEGAGDAASMSVLLVGQRGVLDALRAGTVEPDVLCHLRPLTREQTAEYIAHRLRAAGHRGRLFTPPALRKIWVVSEGIPRATNALCIEALSRASETGRRKVTAAMIDRSRRMQDDVAAPEVSSGVDHEASSEAPRHSVRSRRRLPSLASAAVIALILGATGAVTYSERAPWLSARPAATTASTVTDSATAIEQAALAPPLAPERSEPSTPIASRAPVAVPVPKTLQPSEARGDRPLPSRRGPATISQATDDNSDGNAIIEWLLKGRRAAGGKSIE
jgi:general secretion pathway protein A